MISVIKYNRIMKEIKVTPEMEKRILDNISRITQSDTKIIYAQAQSGRVRRMNTFRQFGMLAACAVFVIGCITIGPRLFKDTTDIPNPLVTDPAVSDTQIPDPSNSVQIQNPFLEMEDLDDFATSLYFPLSVPAVFSDGYTIETAQIIGGKIAEIKYISDSGKNSVTYRMSEGTDNISGDYSIYSDVKSVSLNENTVTMSGAEEMYTLAVWTDGEFSYSISLSDAVIEDDIMNIISSTEPVHKK